MGIEKLVTRTRAERIIDPEIQAGLDREWVRVRESFGRLGDKTKEATAGIIYNSLVLPFVRVRKGKHGKEFAPGKQAIAGAVDSTGKVLGLVGRALLSSGRVAKYGVRRTLVI